MKTMSCDPVVPPLIPYHVPHPVAPYPYTLHSLVPMTHYTVPDTTIHPMTHYTFLYSHTCPSWTPWDTI